MRSSTRSSPSVPNSMPAARAALRASAALTAVRSTRVPVFPAPIGPGDLRPHRPQRSRHWNATGWRGRSGLCSSPLPSASLVSVRISRRREAVDLVGFRQGRGR